MNMHAFGECESSLFKVLYETCKTYLQFSPENVQLCSICIYILYKKNKCDKMENLMFDIATMVFALDKDSRKVRFFFLFLVLLRKPGLYGCTGLVIRVQMRVSAGMSWHG